MRLSEILDTPVYDATGRHIGVVHDAQLTHEMSALPAQHGARTITLDRLVLRNSAVGFRLGYGRRDMNGPALLAKLLTTWARASPVIEWSDIASLEPQRITLHRRAEELRSLGDLVGTR